MTSATRPAERQVARPLGQMNGHLTRSQGHINGHGVRPQGQTNGQSTHSQGFGVQHQGQVTVHAAPTQGQISVPVAPPQGQVSVQVVAPQGYVNSQRQTSAPRHQPIIGEVSNLVQPGYCRSCLYLLSRIQKVVAKMLSKVIKLAGFT